MPRRPRINPLSVLFVIGLLVYGWFTVNQDGGGKELSRSEPATDSPAPQSAQQEGSSSVHGQPNQSGGPANAKVSGGTHPTGGQVSPYAGRSDQHGGTLTGDQPVAVGRVVTGRVVRIIDGDSLEIKRENGDLLEVRLEGIDAPERGQPFSSVARQYLGTLCHRRTVYAMILDQDRYGRWVADLYQENVWINGEMVKAGLAWHYARYNDSPDLATLQRLARNRRRGLWQGSQPVEPWRYRKILRQRGSD